MQLSKVEIMLRPFAVRLSCFTLGLSLATPGAAAALVPVNPLKAGFWTLGPEMHGETPEMSEPTVLFSARPVSEITASLEGKDIQIAQAQGDLQGNEASTLPFTLKAANNFNINLFGLEANVDMSLKDGNGNIIAASSNPGPLPEAIAVSLAAGDYVITLEAGALSTPYFLTAAALENNPPKSPTLVEYVIPSVATDRNIAEPKGPHYVTVDSAVQPQGRLLVFLPGTNGSPLSNRLIAQQAAALGYHAIGLAYPNSTAVTSAKGCGFIRNPDCAENFRLEIADGTDRSNRVTITAADSIQNRLLQVLRYLALQYPEQGWSTFLGNGEIRWSQVVLAGHSQGGGHAAIIAKNRRLAGAVLFAPELDHIRIFNDFAPWLAEDSLTPIESYFTFQHINDPIFPFPKQLDAFALLGLDNFGPPVNVDQAAPPYGNSRQLVTSASPQVAGAEHGSVVVDPATPILPSGEPLYTEVWGFILNQGL